MPRIRYKKMPWRKSYKTIPENFKIKLDNIEGDIQAISSKFISISDIERGIYSHLGIEIINGNIIFKTAIVPDITVGIMSRRNIEGKTHTLKRLPKIKRTYCVEVPNYGGWENGSHDMCQDREVWQKRFEPPREFRILVDKIGDEGDSVHFKFSIEAIIRKYDEYFEENLLFCINLLQENTGVSGIYDSEITNQEYLDSLIVDWTILPVGSRDEVIESIRKRFRNLDPVVVGQIQDRYDFWATLSPVGYIFDPTGLGRYFGAQFSENLVAFENIKYGNAIYIMYENWQQLSKLSRIELMQREENDFDRIVHKSGWKERVRALINRRLGM